MNIPVSKLKEYHIQILPSNIGGREVKITVNTNFPNNTKLSISVGRIYFSKGDPAEYWGEIYSEDFIVKNGKHETTFTVSDTKWFSRQQKLIKSLPEDFPPMAKINDNIIINVLFTGYVDQTSQVSGILGSKGEYITGNGVEEFGKGYKSLRVSKQIKIPFKK